MAPSSPDTRERIVQAAVRLLSAGGRAAVSTRAVSTQAGVQAPAIYRQFSDMDELVREAARAVFAKYVRGKAEHASSDDPVEDLRRGWDLHVGFGLANPAAYTLLYGNDTAPELPEAREGLEHLTRLVTRVAQAGRLRVGVPLAVRMIHAGGSGATFALIGAPPDARDASLSEAMREAVLAAIVVDAKHEPARSERARVAVRALGLQAVLDEVPKALSVGERLLMGEWLDRLSQVRDEPASASASEKTRRRTAQKQAPRRGAR